MVGLAAVSCVSRQVGEESVSSVHLEIGSSAHLEIGSSVHLMCFNSFRGCMVLAGFDA